MFPTASLTVLSATCLLEISRYPTNDTTSTTFSFTIISLRNRLISYAPAV
ncbi:hypothetical protein EVA_09093 [gut metagenome]|uniref:Uncharacterized protein n=1 Tax=gut metagenome TaxID=749906 RepID=J9CRI9_9ZZZZ